MLLITLALLAGSATAADKKNDNDENRVKCKVEQVTGSLAGRRRVCYTVKEWRQIADTSSNKAKDIQDMGLISPTNGH